MRYERRVLPRIGGLVEFEIDCKGATMRRFPVFTADKRRVALRILHGALRDTRRHERVALCGVIRMNAKTVMQEIVRPDITDWIFDSLGQEAYLEDWLYEQACKRRKGFEDARDLPGACDQHWRCKDAMTERGQALVLKLKNTRIAWLEWMIEQVEQS